MPDILKKTISATEAPALFNASPYTTRWMLYRRFRHGDIIDPAEDSRMSWGKRLEPLVLAQAAEDLKLMIEPNRGADGAQTYVRNGLLGCTRDATIYNPDRGHGACETKCVFDYGVWMQRWSGGDELPREIETQLQVQMMVGDGEKPFSWGVIPVWVCGEMKYFQREPIPELWEAIKAEAAKFFDDVANENEPEPVGAPVEIPLLAKLLPIRKGQILDLSHATEEKEHIRATEWGERARLLDWHSREASGHEKAAKALKAQMLTLALGHEEVRLPHGIEVKFKQIERGGYTVKPSTYQTVSVHVPENVPTGDLEF